MQNTPIKELASVFRGGRLSRKSRLMASVRGFLKSEDGPTAVEYAVMLVMVIAACVLTITVLGNATEASFTSTSSELSGTIDGGQ